MSTCTYIHVNFVDENKNLKKFKKHRVAYSVRLCFPSLPFIPSSGGPDGFGSAVTGLDYTRMLGVWFYRVNSAQPLFLQEEVHNLRKDQACTQIY